MNSSFGPKPASAGSFLSNSEHLNGDPLMESSALSKKQPMNIDDVEVEIPTDPAEPSSPSEAGSRNKRQGNQISLYRQIPQRSGTQWAARPGSRHASQNTENRPKAGQTGTHQDPRAEDQNRPGTAVGNNQTKIYISNLNINLNNVFINMNDKDVKNVSAST